MILVIQRVLTIPVGGPQIYIRGRIVTDDQGGNFYKTIVIQEIVNGKQQALRLSVDASSAGGAYLLGQEIMIHVNGLGIGKYANEPQLCVPSYNNNLNANAYWDVHAVPQISIEIGVANIKNDPKYEDYLNLQNFDVGYQGKIYVEHLGINTEMKITSIKRNELTGEAITIKLGSVRGSLIRQTVMSQTIVDPNSAEGVNSANNELLQEEIFEVDTKYMSSSINAMEEYAIAEIEKRTVSELEGG